MQNLTIKKIFFIYIAINSPVFLFLNGVFWDDWILFNTESVYIYERFSQGGLPWLGYYHKILMHDIGPWIYKLLVVIFYFINGLLFSKILIKNGVVRELGDFIFLVYLVLPLFGSRYVASNTQYVLYATMFLIAWLNLRSIYIAAPLFIASFGMQSLLVMYLLPYLNLLLSAKEDAKKERGYYWVICVYTLLPILFFALKNIFFKPYGNYEGYLKITSEKVWHSIYRVYEVTGWTIQNLNKDTNLIDALFIFAIVVLLTIKIILVIKKGNSHSVGPVASVRWLLWMSAFGIFLSVLPYALVGNELNIYYGFESRNHAVFIFPAATLVGAILYLISCSNNQLAKIGGAFFGAACIVVQILIYVSYFKDAYKTNAMVKAINENKNELAGVSLIAVDDKINVPFVEQRKLGVYEYSGIFRLGTARSGFFARDEEYWSGDVCSETFVGSPLYNTQDFIGGGEVTRARFYAVGGYKFPIVNLINYTVTLKIEKNLQWCASH